MNRESQIYPLESKRAPEPLRIVGMSGETETHKHAVHPAIAWGLGLAFIIFGFALTVFILNSTVFSAGGFVSGYLAALERHDLSEALSTPGVSLSSGARTDLLEPEFLGELSDISLVADRDESGGVHTVTFEFKLAGADARSTFLIESTGSSFGFFSTWKFEHSPLATLTITPLHDASFSVNGVSVTSRAGSDAPVPYLVPVPGIYELAHNSTYLFANSQPVELTEPGSKSEANVEMKAKPEFVQAVQKEVERYLDECATQTVLFPTGCPFGLAINDRVESAPAWTIVSYPQITISPGTRADTWVIPETSGVAHLTAEVRSLFDGSVSTLDEDVDFSLSWLMTISGDQVAFSQPE